VQPGVGGSDAGPREEVDAQGALNVRARNRVRRYPSVVERAGLPHGVLRRAVPRQRDGGEDGVRAARVLGGGRADHVELEVAGRQAGRRVRQVGLQDGGRAAAVLGGDEDAAAGHFAGALGVDAPGDPAVGARRRAERDVGGAVLLVVRVVQAGAEHRQAVAEAEGPAVAERPGRAVLRRRGGREEEHGPEEEPRRRLPRHGWMALGASLLLLCFLCLPALSSGKPEGTRMNGAAAGEGGFYMYWRHDSGARGCWEELPSAWKVGS
jgi:hypothetical protein